MKKTLINVITSKGGVGKSTTAVNICDWLSSKGIQHQPVDLDFGNANLAEYLGVENVTFIDRDLCDERNQRHFDSVYNLLGQRDVVVADYPATSATDFAAWYTSIDLGEVAKSESVELVMVCPVSGERDTLEGLLQLHEAIGNGAKWIVVRSEHNGSTQFYETTKLRARVGADEVIVGKLMDPLRDAMRKAHLSPSAMLALPREQQPLSSLMLRRLATWRATVFAQLDQCNALQHFVTTP